uniref:LAGLIDADG endonuclease n=1 Tax=Chrysoporthe austroafricana TaxID=354353 RepID=A0A191MWS0_9PEZI|nr:LAGLIDADG endonuclease [Chrysoporthe austroafricana]AMX22115.1 LAGLIDADG endonuclease [Chrysoporthe austroafricana]
MISSNLKNQKNKNYVVPEVVHSPENNKKEFNLNPWFITGFVDAEGSFAVNIIKDAGKSLGYFVLVYFEIAVNEKDRDILVAMQNYFGAGNIFYNSFDNTCKFKVSSLDALSNVIIPHFKQYFLLTKKRSDFELFSRVVEIMVGGDHLNLKGLQEIVNLKASLNLGLSDKLKAYFPEALPAVRPVFNVSSIPDPHWLAGFAEGESCFYISIYKSVKSKLGLAVQLVFRITQHSRDKELLKVIAQFLECGRVEERSSGGACDLAINSIKDFKNKVIPFFSKYPLLGTKSLNYIDFVKVFELMDTRKHLTEEGLATIKQIRACMNTARI